MRVSYDDRPTGRRWLAILTPIALIAGGVFLAGGEFGGTPAAAPVAASASVSSQADYACATSAAPGQARCLAIRNTAAHPTALTVRPDAIPAGNGYGPADLQSAYGLTSASNADVAGPTIAVVDAYNDPTLASDLATYRSAAGLPALTAGQLTVYNEDGQTTPLPGGPPAGDDWTVEESIDVDMVSAICPHCKIDVVEAGSDVGVGLFVADLAAATVLHATYVSDSWGYAETQLGAANEALLDSQVFSEPGVVYVAGAGDLGFGHGMSYPAASPNVVSVGGTTLVSSSANSRGWTESVWNNNLGATGSGCSAAEPQPPWQASVSVIPTACSHRVDNDVAADADPSTGVAIFDSSAQSGPGWGEYGGVSESTPIIASVFALAGNNGNGGNRAAASIYDHPAGLNEVTGGNDGTCTPPVLCTATGAAGTYNGPTGWGTPDGITAFESEASHNTVTLTSPGSQAGTVGTAVSLPVTASDSDTSQTLTYTATGLPPGLSINPSTGLISGTPTTAGTTPVTINVTDTTRASAIASFTWTISNKVTVTNPGSRTGTVGTAVSLPVTASDSDTSQTLTYAATGLPAGLAINASTGLISGTPTSAGTSQVTITATDTTSSSGTASFTWVISPAAGNTVTVTSPGSQTGTVGTAASVQISASDSAAGQTLTYSAAGLPAGLAISSGGLISGTPTTAGTSQVTITATDTTNASGTASFTWTINPAAGNGGNTITVTNPGTQTGTVGTAASVQISASDSAAGQTLTYSAAGLPAGLTISSGGLISGTPTTAGTSQVTITATDTTNASGTASFTWTINPAGGGARPALRVYSPGSQLGTVGVATSLQILAIDSDSSQKLTYTATGLPTGLSIGASTGLISGAPTTAGTSYVRVTVADTAGHAETVYSMWMVSPAATAAACPARQVLANPGFETGSIKPWSATAGVLAKTKRGTRPQAGSWLARLDGYGAAHTDTLAQTVTIPAGCKNAVLTYWVEVRSSLTSKTQQAKNTLVLDVVNGGKVVKTVGVATAANNGTSYVEHTLSLASYIGKTITIKFVGTEVRGGNTIFLEDSNALNVS